jgi:hypothetical protein
MVLVFASRKKGEELIQQNWEAGQGTMLGIFLSMKMGEEFL